MSLSLSLRAAHSLQMKVFYRDIEFSFGNGLAESNDVTKSCGTISLRLHEVHKTVY